MMLARLVDLEPQWVRWEDRIKTRTAAVGDPLTWRPGGPTKQVTGPVTYQVKVPQFDSTVQGILIRCPKCATKHRIAIAFANRGVLDHHGTQDEHGRPTRWVVSGTSFEDLTLSPSVDCTKSRPDCWHGFIQNGAVT